MIDVCVKGVYNMSGGDSEDLDGWWSEAPHRPILQTIPGEI